MRETTGGCTPASTAIGRTELHRDLDGRVETEVRVQDGRSYRTQYGYDSLGNVEFVTYPSGMVVRHAHGEPDPDRVSQVEATAPGVLP